MKNQSNIQTKIRALRQFRRQIMEHFSLDELQTLCLDLDIDYETLTGENKSAKTRELILLHYRRNNLVDLLAAIKQTNPLISWPSNYDLPEKIENGQTIWEEDNFYHGCLFQIGRYKMVFYLLLIILFGSGLFIYRDLDERIFTRPTIEAIASIPTPTSTSMLSLREPTTSPPPTTAPPPTATNTAVPPTNTPTATLPLPTNTATTVPPTLIPPTPVPATPLLDLSLTPNYGSATLISGFLPDPYTVDMLSGGNVDVSYLNRNNCTGFATAAPDFRLYWESSGTALNFMFIPDFSGNDTTLIINNPAGDWYCSDDFDGLNPGIRFNSALSGQYDIWIGSYSASENISGQLNITELDIPPSTVPSSSSGSQLDPSLAPHNGTTMLRAGFLPDPYTVNMTRSGGVDVSYLNNSSCTGYATAAPDFRLFWEGNSDELNFMFIPDFSGNDTTLIINDPVGNWYCSDDFDSLNPGIRFGSALSGQYDIWIGSYSPEENIAGKLLVSELDIP